MADPTRRGPAARLEVAPLELGARLAYPPTPPIAPAVARRLEAERARRTRPPLPGLALWPRRRVLVLAVLGVLLLAGAAVAARLVIGAIEVRVVSTPPTPTARETGPALGRPLSLEEAQAAVPFEILVPSGLPGPDRVYLGRSPFGERVVLAWRDPRFPHIEGTPWTLIMMELRAEGTLGVKEIGYKDVQPTGPIEAVLVNGHEGLWITGPHALTLISSSGPQQLRVTGNVLVWEQDGVTFRLESMLSRPEAIRIAETMG